MWSVGTVLLSLIEGTCVISIIWHSSVVLLDSISLLFIGVYTV
jgi:hypothetical protein